jgi:hypothetical protein
MLKQFLEEAQDGLKKNGLLIILLAPVIGILNFEIQNKNFFEKAPFLVMVLLFICQIIGSWLTHFFFLYRSLHPEVGVWLAIKQLAEILKTRLGVIFKLGAYTTFDVVAGVCLFFIPGINRFLKYAFVFPAFFAEDKTCNSIEMSTLFFRKKFWSVTMGVGVPMMTALIIFVSFRKYPQLSAFFLAVLAFLTYISYGKLYRIMKKSCENEVDFNSLAKPYPSWKDVGKKALACVGGILLWMLIVIGIAIIVGFNSPQP